MLALASVLAVVLVSLIIVRVATVALSLTGMARESARFQARSALSGVGFTTSESEAVVNHPVRRRIVLALMVIGSAGLITAVASLFLSFTGASSGQRLERAGLLVGGLLVIWLLSRSKWVDRRLSRVISRALRARHLDVRDYATLLGLSGEYGVHELKVHEDDWLACRRLAELRLRDEGVVVLGIHRPGGYVGLPKGHAEILPGDTLVLYGQDHRLVELDHRLRGRAGDTAHAQAAAEQRQLV
jgi:hypothetical protein